MVTIVMNTKILTIFALSLLLVGSVSAYICVDFDEDNEAVVNFKSNLNIQALKNDIEQHNITREGFFLKTKYFNPCNKW